MNKLDELRDQIAEGRNLSSVELAIGYNFPSDELRIKAIKDYCHRQDAVNRLIEKAEAVVIWLNREIPADIMPTVRIARSDVEALAQALEEVKK